MRLASRVARVGMLSRVEGNVNEGNAYYTFAQPLLDWVEQADRFWAGELGVAPRVLRAEGFHVHERADAQPRATIVGTSSATIVSLPEGQAHMFENAGLSLERMERSPRRYVASCASIESLDVRGPAYLAYWPPSYRRPTPRAPAELLGGEALASLASLRAVAPSEWEEAGIGPDSRVFGLRVEERIVAVAGSLVRSHRATPGVLSSSLSAARSGC